MPRPWHYAELHNPWSHAGASYDSWGFLDLCQSAFLLETVASLMGPEIILFDSQWLPDPWQSSETGSALECDAHRFAVDARRGLTVLVCFGGKGETATYFDHRAAADPPAPAGSLEQVSLLLEPGTVLAVDLQLLHRVRTRPEAAAPTVYAVRYFPATSRYNRDPSAPLHRNLTERYPLLNYARMPLWLVRGDDKAGNDFVTGFNSRAGYWSNAAW